MRINKSRTTGTCGPWIQVGWALSYVKLKSRSIGRRIKSTNRAVHAKRLNMRSLSRDFGQKSHTLRIFLPADGYYISRISLEHRIVLGTGVYLTILVLHTGCNISCKKGRTSIVLCPSTKKCSRRICLMIYCSIQSVGIWRTCFKGFGAGGQMGFSACFGKWTEGRKPSHTHYYQGSWIVVSQCQWENLCSLQNRQGKSSGFIGKIHSITSKVNKTKVWKLE